ncbi:MAG: RES family NAD+ phosphorylase [Sediminibacterium sp.]
MILYRFTPYIFSKELNGKGAGRYGGRWNSIGLPVVYTSMTISLALLELLIHNASYDEIRTNYLTVLEVPDNNIKEVNFSQLKNDWIKDESYSRFIGDEFLRNQPSLLLKVPSAIIPEESNVLLNPRHPDFKKAQIRTAAEFYFDSRLFKVTH